MDGYYTIEDGKVVWQYFKGSCPETIPKELRTPLGVFAVVQPKQQKHNESICLDHIDQNKTTVGILQVDK